MPQATQAPDWRDGLVDAPPGPTQAAASPTTTPVPSASAAASSAADWRDGLVDSTPTKDALEGANQATSLSRHDPSLWERLKGVFTEGNPNYSSRTIYDPKYGSMQLVEPNAMLTPLQQSQHKVETALGDIAGGLTSPENLMMLAGSGGLGTLPGARAQNIARLTSAAFGGQAAKANVDLIPQIKAAYANRDWGSLETLLTHATVNTIFAAAGFTHAIRGEGKAPVIPPEPAPEPAPAPAPQVAPERPISRAVPYSQSTREVRPDGTIVTTSGEGSAREIFDLERKLVESGKYTQEDIPYIRRSVMDMRERFQTPGLHEDTYRALLRQMTASDIPIERLNPEEQSYANQVISEHVAGLLTTHQEAINGITQTERESAETSIPTREGLDAGGRRAPTGPEAAGAPAAPLNGEEAIRTGGGVAGGEGPPNTANGNGPVAGGDGGQGTQVRPGDVGRIQASAGQLIPTSVDEAIKLLGPEQAAEFGLTTPEGLKRWQDTLIQQFVEPPAIPLTRQLIAEGKRPTSSNAYGPGDKGVAWVDSVTGREGFTPLNPPEPVADISARAALEELIDRKLTPDELAHVPFMAGVMADFPLMTSEQGERLLMKASKLPLDSLDRNNQVITTPDEEAAHITNKSNELAAVSAELHELTGGTGSTGFVQSSPDAGRTAGARASTGATGSVADRPPVISDYVDRQLANGGITVVKPTGDLGLIRRYFGSLSQGARALGNGRFSHAANIIMDTAIAIARDTRDNLKGFRANVRSIVTEREWQDKVVPLLNNPELAVGKLPPETPEHIAAAYKYTRELLDAHREAARDAKRQEMENGGMDPKTIKKMVPDDWGIKEGYYVHAFPGNWTITLHDGLGEKGEPIWTPIDTGWRQTTLNDAQAKAKEYLAAHPGSQLKVALDTVSLPGKGISDTTRLQELHKTIKDAHQLIYNDQEPEGIIKELLETSGRLTYGPRRVAPRGFGNVMEREANLPGWVRDMDNFERYIMGMQRYINLAPARASLFKLRNEIANMTGMSDVLKPGQLPKRYSGPYANMLGKLDSTIESLEGYPTGFDAAVRNHLQNAGRDPNMLSSAYSLVNSVEALLKLGFNPASAGLHLAQTIAATYPVLGEKWTLYGTAHAYSSKYDSLVHDLGIEATGNFFDTDTLNAYKGGYLGRIPDALRQLTQPSGAHGTDTIAQRAGAAIGAVGSAAYHALSTTGLYMFSKGVETARRIAAIGAYERALQGGADPIAARNEARDVLVRTQFLYNPVDSPEFMKSVPRPMGQFKNFSVKMFEFTLGLRGAEIPRWLAAMSAIGFAGFPMLNVLSNSLAAVLPDHYNIKDELLRHFPRSSRGILGMLGVDYTKNIGFADWLDPEHFDATHLLGPTASDLVRLAQGGIAHIQGPSRTGEQEKDAMWRNISPEARRIYDEAVRMGQPEGSKSLVDARNGSIIIRNLTPAERALMAAGLTPIRVAQERDVHEQIRKEIEQHTDQRGYFVDKLAGLNLELMRHDLNEQQRSQLTHELAATADMAVAYSQGKGLAQAVRERAKGMYSERLLHDVKKAPKALRGDAFERMQEFMTDNPAQAPAAVTAPPAAVDWRDGLVDK